MIEKRTGNKLSTHSFEAVNFYNEAIDIILGSESGAAEMLDKALELDSNFALAAAARYFVANDNQDTDANHYRTIAKEAVATATDWERENIEILFGLIEEPKNILDKAQAYINTTPGDLFIISQLAGYLIFYGGSSKLKAVLNLFESVEHVLGNDWAHLVRLGFAASEAGDHKRGRDLIERALQIRPKSLYTIHALAHLLHDEGAAKESAKLLEDWISVHESSAREGRMYGHVHWHLALAEWHLGERDVAIKRYQDYCTPKTTTCGPVLTLADCGGFLLRDYLASGKSTPLTHDVLEHIERVWGMLAHPFIALHVAGLYASAGDAAGLKKCEENISSSSPGTNRDISLALVSALIDFVAQDYKRSTQTLESISSEARVGIGGSNVERVLIDLIEETSKARH
ncbi:hypothetical protein ACFL17_00230 [Pseudomonadota bacterium]